MLQAAAELILEWADEMHQARMILYAICFLCYCVWTTSADVPVGEASGWDPSVLQMDVGIQGTIRSDDPNADTSCGERYARLLGSYTPRQVFKAAADSFQYINLMIHHCGSDPAGSLGDRFQHPKPQKFNRWSELQKAVWDVVIDLYV